MTKYKIGKTFEEMNYEEMASSQTGVEAGFITIPQQTISWCPIPMTITTVTITQS